MKAVLHYRTGFVALLVLTGMFVQRAPERYGPAAAVLAAALVLDALSRRAADTVSRSSGLDVAMRGQPSLVLALAGIPLLPALCLAALPLLGPGRFPLVASLIAGMLAMSAMARLTMTRSALMLARSERREPLTPP